MKLKNSIINILPLFLLWFGHNKGNGILFNLSILLVFFASIYNISTALKKRKSKFNIMNSLSFLILLLFGLLSMFTDSFFTRDKNLIHYLTWGAFSFFCLSLVFLEGFSNNKINED